MSKSKIVVWCGDAPNQRALVSKIAAHYTIAGIVIDEHKGAVKKRSIGDLFTAIIDRLRFHKIYGAWKSLMEYYNTETYQWPDVPVLRVPSINDAQVFSFTEKIKPDLIIVSGTGLVKEPLISLPVRIGIINLHTGLSPYVKGGPNCTNWCIANNEWHLVGSTIMWLNAGIDSGNIITTERTDIRRAADLAAAHRAVMDHAHDLYVRAIGYLLQSEGPWSSIPQSSIIKGNLYLTRMWTPVQRRALLNNWRKRDRVKEMPLVTTIPLPGK